MTAGSHMTNPRSGDGKHGSDRVLRSMAVRLRWLCGGLGLGLAVIVGVYWQHQIVRAEHYERLAENNRLRVLRLDAPRGLIQDRAGRILAENTPTFRLMMNRSLSADLPASLTFAAGVLGFGERDLKAALERHRDVAREVPVLLAEDLELIQVARFQVAKPEHPEFEISTSLRRLYRQSSQTAHVVGRLGEPTPAERDRDDTLAAGDLVGRSGVELLRDRRLRGEHGERIAVVDSRGRLIGEDVRRTNATPGESVTLTIDLGLQQLAESLLAGKVGAIVALDPRDGAVRAMVSSPSFDPNRFGDRLSQQDWERIVEAPGEPLQNRAIQNTYPPGSVFKIVMAVAGLAEGLMDPEEEVYCSGTTNLFNRRWRCWRRGRARFRRSAGGAAALLRHLLLPAGRQGRDCEDRRLGPTARAGGTDRSGAPRREGGSGARSRVEQESPGPPVAAGRDGFGGHRPGAAADFAAAGGHNDRCRSEWRIPGAPVPDRGRRGVSGSAWRGRRRAFLRR